MHTYASGEKVAPLVSLTAAYTKMATPETVPPNDIWSAPVIDAVKKHENAITNNNGIKTKHFCKLFVPLGFDVRIVDPILLSELDTFGSMRGGEAHSTHRSNILKNYDPFLRRTKALGIVGLLATFDADVANFIKSV